jgi:hypothetical protein
VHVTGNPELTSIGGLQLQGVGGALVFDDNPKLCRSQIEAFVASLVTVGSVTITGNADDC